MTALAGMCLLMEGSTLREGKYTDQLAKAVNWFLAPAASSRTACSATPNNPTERAGTCTATASALLFLASVYGEEEDEDRRKKLEKLPHEGRRVHRGKSPRPDKRRRGATSRATDGGNFDEGSVTITQLQALRAARNAGIAVPKEIIDKAVEVPRRLHDARRRRSSTACAGGGRGRGGQERPPLTAAAVACAFSAGEYNDELRQEVDQVLQGEHPDRQGPRWPTTSTRATTTPRPCTSSATTATAKLFPKRAEGHWLTWSEVQGSDVRLPQAQPERRRQLDRRATSARSSPPP